MDDKDKILNAFKTEGKPMRPGEIAEKTGIDKNEVSKLIKKMKTDELVFSPKRCYYDVKK